VSPKEIEEMDMETFSTYSRCIPHLQARELLFSIEASGFPNYKPSQQVNRKKKIHREAYPEMHEKKALSSEDVAAFLKRKL
jgi:hypothetical protein